MLDDRCRILDVRYWMQDVWDMRIGFRVLTFGF